MNQREPESELEGLKVSLRVILGPNLGCQSQPRQSELENIDFLCVVLRFLLKALILRCVFEGESHQVFFLAGEVLRPILWAQNFALDLLETIMKESRLEAEEI